MAKRQNKDKKGIVSDMQLVADANRRRSVVKDVIFPHLLEMGENVAYSKIFLQSFSGLVEGVFEQTRKTTTVGQMSAKIIEKLDDIFPKKERKGSKEYDYYASLAEKLDEVSIQDLSYAAELPRYIDGFMVKNREKEPISSVDIEAIMG